MRPHGSRSRTQQPPGWRSRSAERPRMRRGAAPQSMRSEGPPRPTTGFRDPPGTRRPPRHGPPGRVRPGEFAAVTAHDAPFAGVRTAADPRGAQNGVRTRSSGAARGREQGLGRHRATLSRPAVRGFGDGTAAYLAEVPGARTVRSTLRTCRSRSPTAPRAGRLRHHPPRGSPPEGQGAHTRSVRLRVLRRLRPNRIRAVILRPGRRLASRRVPTGSGWRSPPSRHPQAGAAGLAPPSRHRPADGRGRFPQRIRGLPGPGIAGKSRTGSRPHPMGTDTGPPRNGAEPRPAIPETVGPAPEGAGRVPGGIGGPSPGLSPRRRR